MPNRFYHIDERILRNIWQKQLFRKADLATADGKLLTIHSPGHPNEVSGPDFLDALITIGQTSYRGDVEIHWSLSSWIEHKHHEDARYNKVILHVVLEGDRKRHSTTAASGRNIPLLVLQPFLPDSFLNVQQRKPRKDRRVDQEPILCFTRNQDIEADRLRRWLKKLTHQRLELKLRKFEDRLRQLAEERLQAVREPWRLYGSRIDEDLPDEIPSPHIEVALKNLSNRSLWDQLIYEGFMEGLGYSRNRGPFLRLSRIVSLKFVCDFGCGNDLKKIHALLFGVAGLLPDTASMNEQASREYADILHKEWMNLKNSVEEPILQLTDWQFFPTRPLNFPTVRIAAAAVIIQRLLRDDLFRKIIQAIKMLASVSERRKLLHTLLSVHIEGFWKEHYDFDKRSPRPVTVLGRSRRDELIINTILPCSLLYARMFKEPDTRASVIEMYETYPSLTENIITRLMEEQLVRGKIERPTANIQQGLIHLYKNYCSKDRCDECEIVEQNPRSL